MLKRHGFPSDPAAPARRLVRAEKQTVDITRALASATRVVVGIIGSVIVLAVTFDQYQRRN